MQLELKLQQAQNDLKSDEEIFTDKEKEINDLKERIKDLESNLSAANRYLEASYAKEKEQQELMVQLQIQLDKMMQGKQNTDVIKHEFSYLNK
jgi:predicted  nucleic acid-binding Zn-ribbon protein